VDHISIRGFYAVLAASLAWGLMLTALVANESIKMGFVPNIWSVLLLGLAIPILGIIIAVKSDNPFFSFIGYNMIILPFGIILGPVVNLYSPDVIRNAFGMTAGITVIMGIAGITFPEFFSKIGGALFIALGGLVLVGFLQIFIPALRFGLYDYIGAGIFSLYIGYDMYRANNMPKTVDNAIDVSVDLYLDIINLFLYILRIMGKK
jgi:FtsH-binding integral membrane protein